MNDKKAIRREIKNMLCSLSTDDMQQQADIVFHKIESMDCFCNAKKILMYYSIPSELPTHKAIDKWNGTKTLLLPRVDGDNLRIYEYDTTKVEIGSYGVTEPMPNCIEHSINDIDLVIVPAMAFDHNGNRLGHGKGYYDRLLASAKQAVKIGIALDCQILDTIPHDMLDVKMDIVISASHTFVLTENI